ncbi:MAG: hypothetical protein IMW94_02060 [Thermoanaerobacter sp.]|nr:hypothetical protein [Thermoanaerobacter sp.]
MPRKRYITSEISTDEKIAALAEENPTAALMWPWFITAFDDWGRMSANPIEVKLTLFPAFPFTSKDVALAMKLFHKYGLAYLYEVDGKPYMAVNPATWYKYQTYINSGRKGKNSSKYPAPPNPPWNLQHSANVADNLRFPLNDTGDVADYLQSLPADPGDESANVADNLRTSAIILPSLSPSQYINILACNANAPDGAAVPDGTRQGDDSLPLPNESESQEEITQEVNSEENPPVITSPVENVVTPVEGGDTDDKVTPLKLKRARNKADPRVRHVLSYFLDTAVKHMGLTPVIDYGKHGKLIKQRLAALDHDHEDPDESLSEMCRLIDAFFVTDDPFVSRAGRTISVFLAANVFEKLRQTLARAQPVSQQTYERPEFLDWEIGGA